MNWQNIIIGLRKELKISHEKLAKELDVGRKTIGRYESGERLPIIKIQEKLIFFIKKNNFDIEKLENLGMAALPETRLREKAKILHIKPSKELAELVGIILGDGEIRKDGTIRISFDPKKDKNFLKKRVFRLIYKILGINQNIYFESNKRIAFGNKNFMKFLEFECKLKPGSKFENNWKIPQWCFEKEEYIKSVLRGLFDTDGYFGYLNGSLELMFGRFSDKCEQLVNSIEKLLGSLNLNYSTQHTKDGRYRIRLQSMKDIIQFFSIIGTSNIKHIIRFLLWRTVRYEARIEIEGLNKLIKILRFRGIEINDIKLPFLWKENSKFEILIKEDEIYLTGYRMRNKYNWQLLTKDLLKNKKSEELSKTFNITSRSIRKWREGKRVPSYQFIPKLFKLAGEYQLDIKNYEVRND